MPTFKTPIWGKSGRLYRPGVDVPESELGAAAAPSTGNDSAEDPNWPKNFPGASDLQVGGVKSAADAQAMDREALLKIRGIGPATADAIAAWGK